MIHRHRLLPLVCLIATLLLSTLAHAEPAPHITGIVSERSAAEVAAGAHRFLEQHPDATITLRTPEQLATRSDAEVAALWAESDALLVAAVFGDEVGRLNRLLTRQPPATGTPILAINSDRQLTRYSRLGGKRILAELDSEQRTELAVNPDPGVDPREHLQAQRERFPRQADWLTGRAYYQGRTPENMAGLMAWLAARAGHDLEVPAPDPRESIRYYRDGEAVTDPADLALDDRPAVALLDLDTGDRPGSRELLDATCDALERRELQCFAVLARWGGASREAVENLAEDAAPAELSGIISLQDFVIGGGGNRTAVTEALAALDVPVIKGLRLAKRTEQEWLLSHDGVPWDNVHYQVAMPELQGMSQPMVLAAAGEATIDERTGVRLALSRPIPERIEAVSERLRNWQRLRQLANSDKRVAVIYYNHPPGRQNIGADKLDVPESLDSILSLLESAGYATGDRPQDPEALLDAIQERGVNLPNDAGALEALAGEVPHLDAERYRSWFETLPASVRAEMVDGPVGYLHARLIQTEELEAFEEGRQTLEDGIDNLRHMLESYEHKAQRRALDLLDQYRTAWEARLAEREPETDPKQLRDALVRTGIPGLSGWGEPPGHSMVFDDAMHFPGITYGNVFIGPQPPRGWEVSERLLHANTTFPPTHQYAGFYHWLQDEFEADAIVYLGRHSTLEFLPRRRVGLTPDDYPAILGGNLPVIYPYIVDGVGEGIQAKRRAMGVMLSHLTPPLATTELYDELLELRQLVEAYESAPDSDASLRQQTATTLLERIEELGLTTTIEQEMAEHAEEETKSDGHDAEDTPLHEMDAELMVHEVGHFVTDLQEEHMPLGLHVYGRDWSEEALTTMLDSMAGDDDIDPEWREALASSPRHERDNLLAALDGRFVPPGQGNDPVRTPEVLPTGRNFHALAADLVPTRVAWAVGQQLAADARERGDPEADGSEAVVLWASDTVRDEGVMVAFGLDMLGIRPQWNSRGIVEGLERMELDEAGRQRRRDALFTTSGLFRDLYEDQLVWLDHAARLALDGASETIRAEHPELTTALEAALAPLGPDERDPGSEPLARNDLAARWVADTRARMAEGEADARAGRQAALRVFGAAPGGYGAGVNRLADRSGAWADRAELAETYLRRMGHAYGADLAGESAHAAFDDRLATVGRTYLGRASHLYGLLDNDDGFDFQGGLSAAVEHVSGEPPANRILRHADPDNPQVESLERALMSELQGQNLNPQWIKPLMDHGYAGARTFARDFIDNLWGWQVTSPHVVQSAVWDGVHDVYLEDRHDLGLDEFLAEGHNVHVKTHIQSVLLVAASRDFWEADPEVLQALSEEFAELVAEHGLPGSGHSRPDHPMLDEVAERLEDPELREAFEATRAAARMQRPSEASDPTRIAELKEATEKPGDNRENENDDDGGSGSDMVWLSWLAAVVLLGLLVAGIRAGRRG